MDKTSHPTMVTDGAVRRKVEHHELDAYAVVHFSRYAAFLETAALARLDQQYGLSLKELAIAGVEMRVRELRLRYKAPARYGDDLLLEAEIERVGIAHVRMQGKVLRSVPSESPVTLAEGMLELVFVITATGQPVPVPKVLNNQEVGR